VRRREFPRLPRKALEAPKTWTLEVRYWALFHDVAETFVM
jgi:hypothetical protein